MRLASILVVALVYAAPSAAARTREPDVEYKDVAVSGKIEGENISFTLDFTAKSRVGKPEMALVTGDLVLQTVPEPRAKEKVRYDEGLRTYYMSWRGKGERTDSVTFACRPAVLDAPAGGDGGNPPAGGDWREAAFTIPASNCRKLELVCDRTDLEVRFPGAVKLEREVKDGVLTVTALLGPGRPFAVRWKPEVQKLEAKLVMACEANTIVRAGTGALRLDTLFVFDISQGGMEVLSFSVPSTLSVTQVRGPAIQDWHIDAAGGAQTLAVTLTRKESDRYALQVTSEMVVHEFPVEVALPVIEPGDVIRASGHVAVGTDSALKITVKEPRGLSQIDAAAFPRYVLDREHPRALPRSNAFYYSYATSPYEIRLAIDDIVPSYDASERYVIYLREDDLVIEAQIELDVRDSAIRDFKVRMDKGLIVAKVEGAQVADYSVKELAAPETTQEVEVQLKQPVIGRALVTMRLELGETPLGRTRKLGAITVPGVRNERGYIAIAPEEGVQLDSPAATNLREVHTGSIPMRVGGASFAYRFRAGDWSLELQAKEKPPHLRTEAFHLVSVGEGIAYGSVAVSYYVTGAPVDELTFRVPKELGNVEFVCRDYRRHGHEGELWTLELQRKVIGDYNVLVTFDQRYTPGGEIIVGGVEPEGPDSQAGYICVASRLNLRLSGKGEAATGLIEIDREEVPTNYRGMVHDPILRSYKYAGGSHVLRFALLPYDRGELVPAVVDITRLRTQISVNNKDEAQSRTTALYKVKNARGQFLALALPEKVRAESVHIVDQRTGRARRVAAGLVKEGTKDLLMVPLERRPDPNEPSEVRVVYTRTHGELGLGGVLELAAPASERIRSVFADWTVSAPVQTVRERDRRGQERIVRREPEWAVYPAGGTMPAAERAIDEERGLAGLMRNVNEGWERALDRLHRSLAAWTVAVLGIGSLVAAFLRRRRLVPTVVLAMLAALLLVVGINAERARPVTTGGDAALATLTFSQPLNIDPTKPVSVMVRVVRPWRRHASVFGAILLPAAALASLVASGFLRRQRTALVAFGVSGLLYAAAQFPDFWPVLGHAFTWGIPAALVAVYVVFLLRRSTGGVVPPHETGATGAAGAPAATAVLIAALLASSGAEAGEGRAQQAVPVRKHPPVVIRPKLSRADYKLRAEKDHMSVELTLVLDAEKPTKFPIMPGSATLPVTPEDPRDRWQLRQEAGAYQLDIKRRGAHRIALAFLLPLEEARKDGLRAFRMTLPRALTNSVSLEVGEKDLQIESPTAVRLTREEKDESTVARAVFGPSDECIFLWKPRARQTKLEKTSFFAEVTSLVRFDAGLAECRHRLRLLIAQGEVKAIRLKVPEGMTVTAVEGAELGTWRFDPADATLEARLAKPATGQYDLTVVTQITADGLPYTVTIGSPEVLDAQRQRGSVGLASTDAVNIEPTQHPPPMNVDDFVRDAAGLLASVDGQKPEVRHAYRYLRGDETVAVEVSEVRPEIRTVEESVFSVGDENLAYNGVLAVSIAKAGLFSASLVIPVGYDIDSLTGPDLSHWDEEPAAEGRSVRLHLKKKVLGTVQLRLTMSRAVSEIPDVIEVPRVAAQGALKVTGTIKVKSERGVRLSVAERRGVSELSPDELGPRSDRTRQGEIAFKLLRPDWALFLKTEVVAARVVVDFLHEANISEGRVRHVDRFRFRVHNAGTKTLEVDLPEGASGVGITGPDMANVKEPPRGGARWRIDLARKWFDNSGAYPLTVRYETHFDREVGEVRLVPAKAVGADLQRGHIVVKTTEKVELKEGPLGEELRPADARSVGRDFGVRDLSGSAFCYGSPTSDYSLVLRAARHDAAKLLGARVRSVSVYTIVTERGESISEVWARLLVGGKRYLKVRLPERSEIWTLFVNELSVTPSAETDADGRRVELVPLGQARSNELSVGVNFVYVSPAPVEWPGRAKKLVGPSFDLPLNNMEWRLYLPHSYEYDDFEGSLTVDRKSVEDVTIVRYEPGEYDEAIRQMTDGNKARAKQFITEGKGLFQQGRQDEARQKLQSAVNLSASDYSTNEDARVQLEKLDQQQAVLGLMSNRGRLRQSAGGAWGVEQQASPSQTITQEQAERQQGSLAKPDFDNLKLIAGRLMGQQKRAAGFARALKVFLRGHGRAVRLSGAIQVEPNAEMAVTFDATKKRPDRDWASPAWAIGMFAALAGLLRLGGAVRRRRRA